MRMYWHYDKRQRLLLLIPRIRSSTIINNCIALVTRCVPLCDLKCRQLGLYLLKNLWIRLRFNFAWFRPGRGVALGITARFALGTMGCIGWIECLAFFALVMWDA